ncbi:MAG: ATP-binding protein [Clostridiales bacterium]|nr:ATP-binding protein [Clostridiales bacterium]
MGIYLNPGNEGFAGIRKGDYIDKSGLIGYVNNTVGSSYKLTCFTRPRRFGKSFAAKMLCAYYDKSCYSNDLFNDLEIAGMDSYGDFLNKYNVIYLDITWFLSMTRDVHNVLNDMRSKVVCEIRAEFPGCDIEDDTTLPEALLAAAVSIGEKFIIIIDEWDAIFREAKDDVDLQKAYVLLLRGLFKAGPITDKMIAAAYMTGILPLKKYGTESALTDFREFTMIQPGKLARYVGFTEDEVKKLCEKYGLDFSMMKSWYDGYSFSKMKHVYSPNSVMSALVNEEFANYWTKSETYESLKNYISMNFDGLKDAIVMMLAGQRVSVDTGTFQNDITSFGRRDDVLTLLIHLGYLAYDKATKEVYIPNLEVAESFTSAVKGTDWTEVNKLLDESEKLLASTIDEDGDAVAEALELAHESVASSLTYNDENSLSCAVLLAYITARNYYDIVREIPAGKGFADYAFIPHHNSDKPAMIIELKYNKDADSAIKQIREKRYNGCLREYEGNLLLVGISYDKNTRGEGYKRHSCIIERV